MEWNDVIKVVAGFIGTSAMATWFLKNGVLTYGKFLTDKSLIEFKNKHEKDLGKLKQQYEQELASYKFQLDVIKSRLEKYDSEQFKVLNSIWTGICELHSRVESCTSSIDRNSISEVINKINNIISSMKYDALYLLDADIDNISDGINSFFEIQINKMKMKDTIKNQFSGIEKSDYDRIYDSIDQYAKIIERLIWEIKKSFKTQLQSPSS